MEAQGDENGPGTDDHGEDDQPQAVPSVDYALQVGLGALVGLVARLTHFIYF